MFFGPNRTKSKRGGQDPSGDIYGPIRGSGPSLDLNFINGSALDSRINFSRASSGTYFDNTGTMQTAASNVPRIDYDPVTYAIRGMLIEESRTNYCPNSVSGITSAYGAMTNTGNAATAPDGTTTATMCVSPSGGGGVVCPPYAAPAAATYTISVWARASVSGVRSFYTSYNNSGQVAVYYGISLTTSWQRIVLPVVVPSGATQLQWQINLGASDTIYLWGSQIEVGPFVTSYIPTTSAAVTRANDNGFVPVGSWFTQGLGSSVADFICPVPNASGNSNIAVSFDNGTNANQILIYNSPTQLVGQVNTSGASLYLPSAPPYVPGVVTKQGISWGPVNCSVASQGSVLLTSATTNGIPTLTEMNIGTYVAGNSFPLNGWIRRLRYWPRALSNGELAQVTT